MAGNMHHPPRSFFSHATRRQLEHYLPGDTLGSRHLFSEEVFEPEMAEDEILTQLDLPASLQTSGGTPRSVS